MQEPAANPIYVGLLFVARCAVPLIILFGLSYLLRKLGLVADTSSPEKKADKKSHPTEKEV